MLVQKIRLTSSRSHDLILTSHDLASRLNKTFIVMHLFPKLYLQILL